MNRRAAALLLCFLGMGALDHALSLAGNFIWDWRSSELGSDMQLSLMQARSRFIYIAEPVGIILLLLAALHLSFGDDLRGNQFNWGLVLVLSLAAGRSVLGRGEGISSDFGLLTAACGVVALLIYALLPRRSR